MDILFSVSHIIIIATALWAIFSPRVNDGLGGKFALALMCFASISSIGWALEFPGSVDRSDAVFAAAVAVMAIRCYWIKHYTARIRRWIKKMREEFRREL